MIRLPNTGTYSLELITAQNGAQSVVSYSDATSSAYTGGTQVASITSATTTTICSTPAASTVRDVDQINIKNTFAGSHTVTVQVDANGTNYPLIVAALLTDESLNYTHGSGWQVKDANGNTKTSPLTSMTSAQLAAILTDETGSGAAVFATGPTLVAPILGTPASGTVTNLTGTASININGTVGATTPAAGAFTTLTSTGNATLGDAEATDTHAIKGATTLLANSASAAFTVTQTGAGNAFVVEDSASTDSTPFVIDANGYVVSGATQAYSAGTIVGVMQSHGTSVSIGAPSAYLWTADANGPIETMSKSRGATVGTHTVVQSGDVLGQTRYFGSDGTQFIQAAQISANVDGTPGTNDMPGRLVFSTTADGASSPTERMRIASDGTTTLGGTSTAPALLVIPVASQVNYLYTAGSATGQTVTFGVLGSDTNINVSYQTKGTGGFYFGTNAGSATQLRIDHTASATRYITLTGATGSNNPTISTSAGALALGNGQLQFPATQNASADANTLDDYEEGTWTPVLTFATTGDLSVAYTTQVASYTKIGNTVRLCWNIETSTFTHTTASGNAQVGTIPFAGANVTGLRHYGSVQVSGVTKATYTQVCPYVEVNDSTLRFQAWGSGAAVSNVAAADMPTGVTQWNRGIVVYQTA